MEEITKDKTAGLARPEYCPAAEAAKIAIPIGDSIATAPVRGLRRIAFTRTEAARMLGIAPISIDRLTRRGLLRPSRALRRPLYREEELIRFLNETSSPGGFHRSNSRGGLKGKAT
jgi:hypothetical protein